MAEKEVSMKRHRGPSKGTMDTSAPKNAGKNTTDSPSRKKTTGTQNQAGPAPGNDDNANTAIMSMLAQIQASQNAQQRDFQQLAERVEEMEQGGWNADEDYFGCDEPTETDSAQPQEMGPDRFGEFHKKFAKKEVTGKAVDEDLANAVNVVFQEGLTEEVWTNMSKEVHRPENCSGLTRVRTNSVIWDNLTADVQKLDSKLQKVQDSICKAGSILTYILQEADSNSELGAMLISKGMEAMGFLGHANANINFRRREVMKPQIERSFHHLCSPAMPFTDQLFGDNLTKEVRDISESNRISGKMRGRGRGRPMFHPYRGGRGRARGQGNARGRAGYYPRRAQGRGRGTPTQ
jgi:hypothetical protein